MNGAAKLNPETSPDSCATSIAETSTTDLVVALKSELAHAFDTKSADRSAKYNRTRYIYALKAISKFLTEVGASSSCEKYLYRLALTLDDLDRGTVDPLLEPIETGGTKKLNASWIWCARAKVSLGILALLKTGLTRADAAKKAASEFPKIEELAALSRQIPSSTATKILSWLDDLTKGDRSKIKNHQALAIFAEGRKNIDQLSRDDAEGLRRVANRMFASALE
jgi:hypothetical protein